MMRLPAPVLAALLCSGCFAGGYRGTEKHDTPDLSISYRTDAASVRQAVEATFADLGLPMESSGPAFYKTRRLLEGDFAWRLIVEVVDAGKTVTVLSRCEVRDPAGLETYSFPEGSLQPNWARADRLWDRRRNRGALRFQHERFLVLLSERLGDVEVY